MSIALYAAISSPFPAQPSGISRRLMWLRCLTLVPSCPLPSSRHSWFPRCAMEGCQGGVDGNQEALGRGWFPGGAMEGCQGGVIGNQEALGGGWFPGEAMEGCQGGVDGNQEALGGGWFPGGAMEGCQGGVDGNQGVLRRGRFPGREKITAASRPRLLKVSFLMIILLELQVQRVLQERFPERSGLGHRLGIQGSLRRFPYAS